MRENFQFPEKFFWGAATSAHQVEGGNRNNWTEWEFGNARHLAAEAAKKKWPDYILKNYPNTQREENYVSGRACDHYHRFREDFDIAKSLGHTAHRFSIEWSRIEPEEGKFNEKEIEHYREVVQALRERGIEPFVTLWHLTLPNWVAQQGGWENKKTIEDFARYIEKIAGSLEHIIFWITLNEPEIYALNGYLRGIWPPQKKSLLRFIRVLNNLAEAHQKAYSNVLKNIGIKNEVGIAKNNPYFEGWLAQFMNLVWNEWFLNKIKNHQDFIGLNYYFHNRIKGFQLAQNENRQISDLGWEIYPRGIYPVLENLKKYEKPIYITENGVADAQDTKRAQFIRDHLYWISRAIADGADIRGYLYWSLLDNFEWDKGFWPRFGLVEVNYKTLQRTIRPSAWEYKKIIDSSARQRVNSEQRQMG